MKKQKYIGVLLGLILILMTACGGGKDEASKGVTAKEAGEIFLNSVFHDKDKEAFSVNFVNSDELISKSENAASFYLESTEYAMAVVEDTDVIEEKNQGISNNILTALREKTRYEIKDVEESAGVATVRVSVYGLDYKTMMMSYMKDVMSDQVMLEDEVGDKSAIAMINYLEVATKDMGVREQSQDISFQLKKDGDKWEVVSDETEIASLIMTFATGVSDEDALVEELGSVIDEVISTLEFE